MKGISFFRLVVLIIIVAVVSQFYFVGLFRAQTDDMSPTINEGGFYFARHKPYETHRDAKRGDVVLFEAEADGKKVPTLGRVIGITGDKIELKGREVILNGKLLLHEELRTEEDRVIYRETLDDQTYEVAYDQYVEHEKIPMSVEVDPRYVFVLGDNRTFAKDSTRVGPILAREGVLARKQ